MSEKVNITVGPIVAPITIHVAAARLKLTKQIMVRPVISMKLTTRKMPTSSADAFMKMLA